MFKDRYFRPVMMTLWVLGLLLWCATVSLLWLEYRAPSAACEVYEALNSITTLSARHYACAEVGPLPADRVEKKAQALRSFAIVTLAAWTIGCVLIYFVFRLPDYRRQGRQMRHTLTRRRLGLD